MKQTRRFRAHSAILHNTCDRGAVLLEALSARLLTQFSLLRLLEALEGHIQTFWFFYLPKRAKKETADPGFIHIWPVSLSANQDYKQSNPSWAGNKVNPLYDPATICVPALVIGLLYALHHDLIQHGDLMVYINIDACIFFLNSHSSWTAEDCKHIWKQWIVRWFQVNIIVPTPDEVMIYKASLHVLVSRRGSEFTKIILSQKSIPR